MSYPNHTDPDGYDDPGTEGTGIFPVLEPLPEAAAGAEPPGRLGPERWLIAGGAVIALVTAFIAVTAGGPPIHAMPSPFGPAMAATSHTQETTPATCTPIQ